MLGSIFLFVCLDGEINKDGQMRILSSERQGVKVQCS